MRIAGQRRFEAPRARVWDCLHDPQVLAGTLPGFQSLEPAGEGVYAGALQLGVGPVQGRFEGRVQLTDLQPPESYRLRLSGSGGAGFVEGEGRVALAEDGAGTTVSYEIDLQIGGRIAAVGQRMLEMTAKMLAKQALDSLARRLA